MVERHKPVEVDDDPAPTINRVRAVVSVHRDRLGDAKAELLNALLDYQHAVNDVVQRLEHGDQKSGSPLTWDDARAAVFQTANMMCEFDRVLHTS